MVSSVSVPIGSPVTSEQRGYRRGLILGLTMAESMLLLVFCLLLAAGAMIIKERKAAEAAIDERDQLKQVQEELAKNEADHINGLQEQLDKAQADLLFLQEKLKQVAHLEDRPLEDWRELELAKQQLARLEQAELRLSEIVERAEVVKAVIERRLSLEDIQTAAQVAENADVVTAALESEMTAEEIRAAAAAAEQPEVVKAVLEQKLTVADIAAAAEMAQHSEVVKAAIERKMTVEDIERAAEVVEKAEIVEAVLEKQMTAEDITRMTEAFEKLKSIKKDGTHLTEDEIDDIVKVARTISEKKDHEITFSDALEEVIRKASLYEKIEENQKPHEWPPIINLSEADSYFFRSGSAELSPSFEEMLTANIAQQIADTASQYEVDIIEVIGHTDEQRMGRRQSNLDEEIKSVLTGKSTPSKLQAADNAGLGLSRAIAVAEVLKRVPGLQKFTILPMSGAQLIMPGDNLTNGSQSGDVASRRRIEIRVRKRNELTQATQPDVTP
jgi:outer membrane protein OmpA-like peptidoglycan-associated protein